MVMSRRATDRGFSSVKQTQFDILSAELMDKVAYSEPGTVRGAEDPEADPMDSADLVTPYMTHSFLMQVGDEIDAEEVPAEVEVTAPSGEKGD